MLPVILATWLQLESSICTLCSNKCHIAGTEIEASRWSSLDLDVYTHTGDGSELLHNVRNMISAEVDLGVRTWHARLACTFHNEG